ncbi:hypothetical protein Cgig2_034209 [Carnegiea gigantea]|uniref:Uncharacterized protein n=1 Tax=Carnegiea gigantea TaxID=171969 RepID=A0A9Q1GZ39_9CARY|nr:hypothetical protein Cgig2_034209 [Carnegiea gigantea]
MLMHQFLDDQGILYDSCPRSVGVVSETCPTWDPVQTAPHQSLDKLLMAMEDQNNDDMDSLFEGMVLFTPQIVDNHDGSFHSEVVQSVRDIDTAAVPSVSAPSSQPLNENLFSDLTVITSTHVEASEMKMPSNPSSIITSNTSKIERDPVIRQSSRKKRRAGLRIGYGRDSQLVDDPEPLPNPPDLSSVAESSFSAAIPILQTDLVTEGKERQGVLPSKASQSAQIDSSPIVPQNDFVDGSLKGIVQSHSHQMNRDGDLNLTEDEIIARATPQTEEVYASQKQGKEEGEATSARVDGKYEQIKDQISDKLRRVREQAASISAAKKDSRRRRRQAAENVQLASQRYREIEKKLEEACEAEDFEMAEHLSESLAAAEKEKENLLNALWDAEAECDAIDSKMQEALEQQIAAEEGCVFLLQHFSVHAACDADSVLESVEVNSSNRMDEWYSLVEVVEAKRLELEIESQLMNEARSRLNDSIGHLVENDVNEKVVLCEKKKSLAQELENLLSLVREKEAEIAENDAKIEAVDKRIGDVALGFKDVQTGIDAMIDKLQVVLSEMESEREALWKKKHEVDSLLSQGVTRSEELRKLAMASADEANMHQKNLGLRKALVTSVLKVKEEKLSLVKTGEKISADVQNLKRQTSVARASLQVSSPL